MSLINTVIADDHELILLGLRSLLETAEDISIAAECSNGIEALDKIRTLQPDVALLDISMPGMDGITLTALLKSEAPGTSVVILSTHDDPVLLEQAINVGACAYILKNTAFDMLIETIRMAATGKSIFYGRNNHPSANVQGCVLTDREKEVLGMIANGLTNRMIAENMKISINTVNRHRFNLMTKLGLHSTAEMVRYAIKTTLI